MLAKIAFFVVLQSSLSFVLRITPTAGPGNTRRTAAKARKQLRNQDRKVVARGAGRVLQTGPSTPVLGENQAQYALSVASKNLVEVSFENGTSVLVNTTLLHQTRDQELWLNIRKCLDLTASEFGAVLGKSRFTNRDKLMLDKLGLNPKPFRGNAGTAWGLRVEPQAVAEYAKATGHIVFETGLHIHDNLRLGASPDGLVFDPNLVENNGFEEGDEGQVCMANAQGLLEVKCLFGRRTKKELTKFDHCPNRFYDQIQVL